MKQSHNSTLACESRSLSAYAYYMPFCALFCVFCFSARSAKLLKRGMYQCLNTIIPRTGKSSHEWTDGLITGKRCSASIMADGIPVMKCTISNFMNGRNICTETRRVERLTAISAQVKTASELLSRFDVLRLSAYAIGFSKGFYR